VTGVVVETWPRSYADHAVGGSVYAVDPTLRMEAGIQLAAARCRVHGDVILGRDLRNRGVSRHELTAIRQAVPAARMDLHLIALGNSVSAHGLAQERRAIETAMEIGAECITVSEQRLTQHAGALDEARALGIDIWLEIPPDDPGLKVQDAAVDGALVMFIEPGTKQRADPAHLEKVGRLSRILPVGVDGGITRKIAAQCLQSGASYVVSGRDLLTVTHPQPRKQRERDLLP
jgi:pentose-5-phosphate-3-epimerase